MKCRWLKILLLHAVLLTASIAGAEQTVLEMTAIDYSSLERPQARYGKIRILSAYKLDRVVVDGHAMVELSGLAWSEDEQILYALSDHGIVFHLLPEFSADRMTGLSVKAAYALKNSQGQAYRYPWADAEGLDVLNSNNRIPGDDVLLVAFEIRPRVEKFDSGGRFIGSVELPQNLDQRRYYKAWNRSLEAVTEHPRYGVLVVPELPLSESEPDVLTLFSTQGKQWSLPRDPEQDLSVVALEANGDGSLILLQRKFQIIGAQWELALARLILHEDHASYELLSTMKTAEGVWVDNFEGLARHRNQRYFMVSDDNESLFQDTVLIYFEIVD
jgi:hypothetical protein